LHSKRIHQAAAENTLRLPRRPALVGIALRAPSIRRRTRWQRTLRGRRDREPSLEWEVKDNGISHRLGGIGARGGGIAPLARSMARTGPPPEREALAGRPGRRRAGGG